ncbi:2'-5' RNA ligase family protein [Algoriphagus sp.]|uniref:2'-5' RNA ligase family protein n=1 Tax=Algoriphagus sp. TaxID=1872435 RepID=UPI00391C5D6A
MRKYFLALVPPADILEKAHNIKLLIRDEFGIKYALKSPPHITLKMPFSYNEAKEMILEKKLSDFLKGQDRFLVKIQGVGTFGNRVIFLKIEKTPELELLQSSLKTFCKKELNLIDELSDRNYHPHLTVAFKDLKPNQFAEVYDLVKENSFFAEFFVDDLVVLKRMDQKWTLDKRIAFGKR